MLTSDKNMIVPLGTSKVQDTLLKCNSCTFSQFSFFYLANPFCSVSTCPLWPCISHASRSASIRANSSSVSVTLHAPRFSMILSLFLEPGIGTTFGYLWSIYAREICAFVASFWASYWSRRSIASRFLIIKPIITFLILWFSAKFSIIPTNTCPEIIWCPDQKRRTDYSALSQNMYQNIFFA